MKPQLIPSNSIYPWDNPNDGTPVHPINPPLIHINPMVRPSCVALGWAAAPATPPAVAVVPRMAAAAATAAMAKPPAPALPPAPATSRPRAGQNLGEKHRKTWGRMWNIELNY